MELLTQKYRGTGGQVFVQPTPDPNPIAYALLEGARSIGIPTFRNQNGQMMEGKGGASIRDVRVRGRKRQSVFRSYTFQLMDRPNLTVLPHALVTRLSLEHKRATGVEIFYEGKMRSISADLEVVLSLGAIQTPKVLMQSGIGDQVELQRLGIPVIQHLPGVGDNFQDHPQFGCIWEHPEPLPSSLGGVILFWSSESNADSPNLQILHANFSKSSTENAARFGLPMSGWTLLGSVIQPKSRGRIRLSGSNPLDPVQIEANYLWNPDDLKAAIACVKLCQEIGNSYALRPFAKREVMPGNLKGTELENFVRDGVITYWHQACTSKMGRDDMSVVDGNLRVYGIDNLRIADSSIMPHITTGGTMAPCVVIGERAAELLRNQHKV
jgi:choline dehydrogenase